MLTILKRCRLYFDSPRQVKNIQKNKKVERNSPKHPIHPTGNMIAE
jgi:hypothetical protein